MLQRHTVTNFYTTLQHTVTHRNELQRTATQCNALQHCITLQHTAPHTAIHKGGDGNAAKTQCYSSAGFPL